MAPTKIPTGTSQYDILSSGRTYLLDTNASLNVTGDQHGIFADDSVHDDTIVIRGSLTQSGANFAAIRIDAENMTINIAQHGSVTGTTGIASENPEPSTKLIINNDGTIDAGAGFAIETQDSKEIVTNHGTINGKIQLGSGNDIFDNRGGHIDHQVMGGAGDDTLFVDRAGDKLKENGGSEGFDTVKSTVSYTLSENVEKLVLLGHNNINGKGTDGESHLQGNSGNNKLTGVDGSGSDTFIFKTNGGRDTLMDYDAGIDKIDVSKWNGMDNFQDIKQHMTETGGDVHIKFNGDELIINDTHKSDLHAGDFQF